MVLKGDLHNNFAGSVETTPIDLHQDLPDVIRVGMRYRPERDLELRLFGDLTRWSAFEDQCIARRDEPCELNADGSSAPGSGVVQNVRRDWNDAFGIRAGLSSWVEPALEVFTGAGYDSNAVPDETLETSLMDFDDVSLAVGARYELASRLFVAASYTQFYNFPRDTRGKSEHAQLAAPSNGPDSGGRYTDWAGLVNLNLEHTF
jgi:long-chain fatty acid transport protein